LSSKGVNIALLSQSIPGGILPGTMLLVEFDPESQWFSVAVTIAARFCRPDQRVCYLAMERSLEDVKDTFAALGVDVTTAIKNGYLVVEDWYSATLTGGRTSEPAGAQASIFEPIEGGLRVRSLKIADLSLEWLRTSKSGARAPYDIVEFWPEGSLIVAESFSGILRFNEEKAFVEWMESRVNPEERKRRSITIQGLVRGIHSDWLYKRMESASDGIIDLRVMEREEETKNLIRVRSLKGQPHDSRWHEIEIKSNGEAILVDSSPSNRSKRVTFSVKRGMPV
jgi:KaiC/GvpD/RAD55 family RecA-like ATPase